MKSKVILAASTSLDHLHHHHHHQQQPQLHHLSQQENPLAIRPDNMIHMRPHVLPPQVCSPQAGLSLTHTHTHTHMSVWVFTPTGCAKTKVDTKSISVLEWPMLQTMQPFFILSRCFLTTTFLLPLSRDKPIISVSFHFMGADKPAVTCAGDDHVHLSDHFLHFNHSEAVHAKKTNTASLFICLVSHYRRVTLFLPGLKGADGIHLCNIDDRAYSLQRGTAAFSNLHQKKRR